MLRSMYSGISGLKNFQTKLDVIGNNIANVNTFGFKKGRVTFSDMISQNVAGASAPTASKGGTNAMQVGLGASISAIDTIQTQGNLQSTGRLLDLAVSGDGYFAVASATITRDANGNITTATVNTNDTNYTRAGNFYLDKDGCLVNSEGLYVLGVKNQNPVDKNAHDIIKIPTDAKDITIAADGTVSYIANDGTLTKAGQIVMTKFANTGGLQKTGNNLFKNTENSGAPVYDYAGQSGIGSIVSSALEMSNVDLSEEFTEMIVAQRGFQANTRIITTSDEILQELVNLKR